MYGLDFWRGARPVDSLSTARLEFGLKLCWVQKCVCMSAKYPVRSRRDLSCMYDSVPMCQSRVAHLELSTFHWVRNHRPLPRPQNTHPTDYTLSKQARFAQTQQVYTYTYFKYATSVKRVCGVCMNRMLILFFKFSPNISRIYRNLNKYANYLQVFPYTYKIVYGLDLWWGEKPCVHKICALNRNINYNNPTFDSCRFWIGVLHYASLINYSILYGLCVGWQWRCFKFKQLIFVLWYATILEYKLGFLQPYFVGGLIGQV